MSKRGKILVAMSGGIDSTVAAMLLHDEGYEVIGVTMKTWDYAHSGGSKKETGCCSLDSLQDARRVAVDMGFHHFILDLREEFGEAVIDDFVSEYLAGRTPNPCILCNTHIKWDALLRRADALSCEWIATGHYARTRQEEGRHFISRAADLQKDQSYVLWGLSQECLQRTVFPLGDMQKPEVRAIAQTRGYQELAGKAESYEICFIPDNDYRDFLRRREPDKLKALEGGLFVDAEGRVIGHHDGYPFFTIGQRKGLGAAFGKPMFVSEIHPESNVVVLSDAQEMPTRTMDIARVNWQKREMPLVNQHYITKIRYRDPGQLSTIQRTQEGVRICFEGSVKSIAPGQSAVVYDGPDVLCGGIICPQIGNGILQ
ncbi:MAG: tRNA 2-thiouridine(34) synthase MnmA [Saprospiraceae bacterium]|nr:tRNA 2-thiouridine(34) synthase MnmA [Saprospiraceae bacterium]